MEMEWNGMVMHVCMYIAYDVRYRFRDAYGIALIWQKKRRTCRKANRDKGRNRAK